MSQPPSAAGPGMLMRSPEGTVWTFDPGALWLEFLLTGGPGALRRHDVLHRPADLAAWLARCRLRLPAGHAVISPADVTPARLLRDTLWRLALRWVAGDPGAGDDLAVLNQAAAAADLVPQLDADGSLRWGHPASGTQALATIARDAVLLRAGPFGDRIRECAAHDCSLIFVDTSRPGARRWCSMQRCGNRAKARGPAPERTRHGHDPPHASGLQDPQQCRSTASGSAGAPVAGPVTGR